MSTNIEALLCKTVLQVSTRNVFIQMLLKTTIQPTRDFLGFCIQIVSFFVQYTFKVQEKSYPKRCKLVDNRNHDILLRLQL